MAQSPSDHDGNVVADDGKPIQKGENRMRETKKKLLQETVTILKKLDKESLAIIRSNAEILRARDTLEEQKAG